MSTITAIALGERMAKVILEDAKEVADVMPKVFIIMCTPDGEAGMYYTNMERAEVSHLLFGCMLETQGVFTTDED